MKEHTGGGKPKDGVVWEAVPGDPEQQRIVWVDRFPIRVGIRSNGPWVAAVVQQKTPYGTSAGALAEAINATDENREDQLRGLRAGKGFSYEVCSVLPLSKWGKERSTAIRRLCKGYYDHLSDDELWLCQSFDDDDFVVVPYSTLLKILEIASYFKEHGELPQ